MSYLGYLKIEAETVAYLFKLLLLSRVPQTLNLL